MAKALQAGSNEVAQVLQRYADLADDKDAKKQTRKLEGDLQLQQSQNQGQIEVANLRNTGALDQQKLQNEGQLKTTGLQNTGALERQESQNRAAASLQTEKLGFEKPLQDSQGKYYNSYAGYLDRKGENESKAASLDLDLNRAKIRGLDAATENQTFTNSLARKYGETKLTNELKLQDAGVDKISNEVALLNEQYDKTRNDQALGRATQYVTENNSYIPEALTDFKQQRSYDVNTDVASLSGSDASDYADRILGKAGLFQRFNEAVPILGGINARYRATQAKAKAREQFKKMNPGVALPE